MDQQQSIQILAEALTAVVQNAIQASAKTNQPITGNGTVREYYSYKDAAAFLGCCVSVVKEARKNGELAFIKKGKRIFFHIDDLRNWMQLDRISLED